MMVMNKVIKETMKLIHLHQRTLLVGFRLCGCTPILLHLLLLLLVVLKLKLEAMVTDGRLGHYSVRGMRLRV